MERGAEIETLALGSPGGRLRAAFAPAAGMVCCSLRHDGQELLAQREGLSAYAERGSTMGIPLLHPWANRLSGEAYGRPPRRVELDAPAARRLVRRDANGLPIHGVIGSRLEWSRLQDDGSGSSLRARMRWDAPNLLEVFPFPHTLELEAALEEDSLTFELVLTATGEAAVPLAYGHHPYLTLPGSERPRWRLELPAMRRLTLDPRGLPTGAGAALPARSLLLADGDWDDAFDSLAEGAVFSVSDGQLTVAVEFLRGYPCAQVYAPSDQRFICFEPMTAPTNALVSGAGLRTVAPGAEFRSRFRISVSRPS